MFFFGGGVEGEDLFGVLILFPKISNEKSLKLCMLFVAYLGGGFTLLFREMRFLQMGWNHQLLF